REVYVWIQLLHYNILPLEGVTFAEEFGLLPALVTPWMENGSLDDYLKREDVFNSDSTLQVREVAAGLEYLHDKGIVHGDLTATNVLVGSDGRLCLADFGLSMILAESGNATFNLCHSGNVRWAAPELFDEYAKPTKASDIYSYGCIMMQVRRVFPFKYHDADIRQVFSGLQPYASFVEAFHVIAAVVMGREPFSQLAPSINEEIERFAQLCLSRNMEYRPLVGEMVENIAKTMKTMVSQPLVTVTRISQADLTKREYHSYNLGVLGAVLKCKWVVHGSGEIEVSVYVLIYETVCNTSVDRSQSRFRGIMLTVTVI
ncbi:kinase-like protein, partial [Suillus hirtellus]